MLFATTFIAYGQSSFYLLFNDDREAPSSPTSPSALGSAGAVAVSWTDPTALDCDSIRVYAGTSTAPTTWVASVVKGTQTYNYTGLTPGGTIYYFRLKAKDQTGNLSAYTSTVQDTVLPVVPVITATNTDATWRNTITHDPIIADSIRIYKGTSADPTTWVKSISGADASSHVDSNLTEGVTYWYRAKSLTGSTFSGYSANDSSIINHIAPSAPTSLAAVGAADKITLTWVDPTATDLDSIIIYRGVSTNPTDAIDTVGGGIQTYVDTAHSYGTVYFYRLKAFDLTGNLSAYSDNVDDTILVNLGSEMLANGDFDDATGWSLGTNITVGGGTLNFATLDGGYNNATHYINGFTIGHTYRMTWTISNYVSGQNAVSLGGVDLSPDRESDGTFTFDYVVASVDYNFYILAQYWATSYSIDNASVKEILNP